MELVCKASAKYAPLMNEVCEPLFELLKQQSALEKEMFGRDKQLDIEKEKAGIPSYQTAPGWNELMAEYSERLRALLEKYCTENQLSRGFGISYGEPQEFGYVNGECLAEFKMRNADKAIVEFHYEMGGLKEKHKFVMRLVDGKWLVDGLYYGFEGKSSWHIHNF